MSRDDMSVRAPRNALVTGGTRGIGLAVVRALTDDGMRCAAVCRTSESANRARSELGDLEIVVADVRDPVAIAAAVDTVADSLGGIDVLVNNAGRVSGNEQDGVLTTTRELMLSDFTEKALGYLEFARVARPFLAASGTGRIVNIGGEAARIAHDNVSSGARNAAVVHLTKSLAAAFGADGITVNAVHPGLTLTEGVRELLVGKAAERDMDADEFLRRLARRNDIRRLVEPQEVAAVVAFLASPAASGITGESIAVSGGSQPAVFY